ncbi:L,D-transpeptidase family protein [Streptomyces sp. NPDC091292]|uniref:L,D-transpeptidase family protein n=1 Tax=Streptomyces sp. NPDC091292 TaxID=3365991 RepID=UPI0037F93CD3
MRTGVIDRSGTTARAGYGARGVRGWRVGVAVAAVTAVVSGCTAQAVGTDGKGRQAQATPSDSGTGSGKGTTDPKPDKSPGGKKPGAKPAGTTANPSASAPAKVLLRMGDSGARVRDLQARLRAVAWLFDGPTGRYDTSTVKAVKGFQGKRGLPETGSVDTVTLERLAEMTEKPTRDELYANGGQPAAEPDPSCLKGRVLCISKNSRTLTWMVDGAAISTMDVRFGSQYTPTREGTFTVYWKSRDHVSTLYHTPMPYAMFFSGGQAVHFSSDFAARGYTGASHGCVNVKDKEKIASLFGQVRTGDKVVIYW